MRHRKAGRQLGRNTSHRRAMLRALTGNLIAHERIETTDAKAKELRRVAERMITKARRLGSIAFTPQEELSAADKARRQSAQKQVGRFLRRFAVIHDGKASRTVDLIEKVFVDLARRYRDRPGGYTRIIKVGRRRGDNAPMSLIELVGEAMGGRKKAEAPAEGAEEAGEAEAGEASEASEAAAEASEAKEAEQAAAEEAKSAEAGEAGDDEAKAEGAGEAKAEAKPEEKAE